jgi:hypothetical protein
MQATNLGKLYQFPLLDWNAVEQCLDGMTLGPGSGGPRTGLRRLDR